MCAWSCNHDHMTWINFVEKVSLHKFLHSLLWSHTSRILSSMDSVPCCGLLCRKQKIQSGPTKSLPSAPQKVQVAFWKGKKTRKFQGFSRLVKSSNRIPSLTQADPFQRLKPQDQLRIGEVAPWWNRNRFGGGEWGENGAWNVSMVGTRLMGFCWFYHMTKGFYGL